jgi:hypothetical protein
MKIRKAVTEKVIAANQSNSRKSTGPHDTSATRQNAITHGLLARQISFQTEEQKEAFDQLHDELMVDEQPVGAIERALVEEAAMCLWKMQLTNGWEIQELDNRRAASKAIMTTLADHHDQERMPLFTRGDGAVSAAALGWDCQELVVRCEKGDSEQDMKTDGDRASKSGHTQIEARLTTSPDSILRYQAAIKRDFYRAIDTLRAIQRERREES